MPARRPTDLPASEEGSSSSGPYLHSGHQEIFVTSSDDFRDPLPSPPYRRVATTSQVELSQYPVQSPPYSSQHRLPILITEDMDDDRTGEKPLSDEKPKVVHYPEDVGRRPPGLGALPRFESHDNTIAPSLAGTDDEDDQSDYDWSGDEDLVDEEEKFEKKMGVQQKPKGWGLARSVSCMNLI